MGKFLLEGREKSLTSWLSQFSFGKCKEKPGIPFFSLKNLLLSDWWQKYLSLGRPFFLPSKRNFPISFKPKVTIAEFFWKMQRKTLYFILGVDAAMPLSLKNLLLSKEWQKPGHVIVFSRKRAFWTLSPCRIPNNKFSAKVCNFWGWSVHVLMVRKTL